MSIDKPKCIVLNAQDNVAVALVQIEPGEEVSSLGITAVGRIPSGHKIAITSLGPGDTIIKYGRVIGFASESITAGSHVHVDNMAMPTRSQQYVPGKLAAPTEFVPAESRRTFDGFMRSSGQAGTRNYLGIIATVSCSGDVCHFIADAVKEKLLPHFPSVDGVVALSHGSGCCHAPGSEGLEILQRTLSGYALNPNFGGILFVGLGCETNLVGNVMDSSGLLESDYLKTLNIQNAGGTAATVEVGLTFAKKMLPGMDDMRRQRLSAEHLVVGLECGGSDAYSGITANPALGVAVDLVVKNGGTAILSETPEIYGAEHLLIERAATEEIGEKLIERIRWWEDYTSRHGAQINNNPTPGNKAGGISTILEKSMGAVTKAGSTNLNGVYRYAERAAGPGLVFMDSPGYDVVSITGMIAGGANLVCFTTGRGTVCGFRPVPTMKLATNSTMFKHLEGDMDINCGSILDGESDIYRTGKTIFETMLATASGQQTKSEALGFGGTEFVPWQMGAIL